MSLAITVAVPDGIIAIADSRTTLREENGNWRISTDNADKITVCDGLIVATAGSAHLNGQTIINHLRPLEQPGALGGPATFDDKAAAIGRAFADIYATHKARNLGGPTRNPGDIVVEFLVSGYDAGLIRVARVIVHEPQPPEFSSGWLVRNLFDPGGYGMAWIGTTDVVERLFNGYAASFVGQMPEQIADALRASGPLIAYDVMKLQDALNIALFGMEATMLTQRFAASSRAQISIGETANVGGPIDIVQMTADGHTWHRRKKIAVVPQFGTTVKPVTLPRTADDAAEGEAS